MSGRDQHAELLSTGEAARLLGSSRQHVVDLCTRGELPFVWAGRHRRVPRSAVDGLLEREPSSLTRDQERSLWLHRALLASLVADPDDVLSLARANVTWLLELHKTGMAARWLAEWKRILDSGVDEVADVLTSRSPLAVELRQNSPFAGALSQETDPRSWPPSPNTGIPSMSQVAAGVSALQLGPPPYLWAHEPRATGARSSRGIPCSRGS